MIDFTISCSTLEDVMTLEKWGLVDAHINWAEKAIQSGGRVVFERKYENAPSETAMVIASQQELADWRNRVSQAIEALKKIKK